MNLQPKSAAFPDQVNGRVTAIEESFVTKRAAYKEFAIESLETDDGPLYRVVGPDGKTLSPLFFSEKCLKVFLTRIPLLTHEEWENYPLNYEPEKVNETNA